MMVYAYVHRITEFGENEPSVQKSVFKRLRVEHCSYCCAVQCKGLILGMGLGVYKLLGVTVNSIKPPRCKMAV